MNPYARLRPFDRESGALNVVIDTPKGSRNKFAWDEKLKAITDLDPVLLDEIEHFFVSHNEVKGKKFKPLRRLGSVDARKLVACSRR